jgi:hypothetical protein
MMFSLKNFLEVFVAGILQLPILYLRAHCFVLLRGVRGAYLLERLSKRSADRFLSLRAIAIINVILIFAIVQGINSRTESWFGVFLTSTFKPDSILDPQFSRTLAAFVMMYCLYFLLARILGKPGASPDLFAATALYFASLSLLLYFLYFIVAFSHSGIGLRYEITEAATRFCVLGTYAYAFWQAGAALASRLSKRITFKAGRPVIVAALGVICFGIYLVSLWLCLNLYLSELLWPNIRA